jgi:hypothetical protein
MVVVIVKHCSRVQVWIEDLLKPKTEIVYKFSSERWRQRRHPKLILIYKILQMHLAMDISIHIKRIWLNCK